MTIRVLRILEYRYQAFGDRDEAKVMTDDMSHWGVDAIGSQKHGGVTIASTVLLPESVPVTLSAVEPPPPTAWFEAVDVSKPGDPHPTYVVGDLRHRGSN